MHKKTKQKQTNKTTMKWNKNDTNTCNDIRYDSSVCCSDRLSLITNFICDSKVECLLWIPTESIRSHVHAHFPAKNTYTIKNIFHCVVAIQYNKTFASEIRSSFQHKHCLYIAEVINVEDMISSLHASCDAN